MLLQIKQDHEGPGPSLSLGIEVSKKWYKAMGDGAASAGSYVSYCGMTPRVLMVRLTLSIVLDSLEDRQIKILY